MDLVVRKRPLRRDCRLTQRTEVRLTAALSPGGEKTCAVEAAAGARKVAVPPDLVAVFDSLDGRETIADLAERLHLGDEAIGRLFALVRELRAKKLVRVLEPARCLMLASA